MIGRFAIVAALFLLTFTIPVCAYDDHDYCLDVATADRLDCTADKLAGKAECANTRAFDKWIDNVYAEADYLDCTAYTLEQFQACRGAVDRCLEE